MKKLILATLLMTAAAQAADIKILSFYRLNRTDVRDLTAEVCYEVSPAPEKHAHVEITVDKGTNSEGFYEGLVGKRGKSCTVISTFRGRVEVAIEDEKKSVTKSL